jgi:hypothetical protein
MNICLFSSMWEGYFILVMKYWIYAYDDNLIEQFILPLFLFTYHRLEMNGESI